MPRARRFRYGSRGAVYAQRHTSERAHLSHLVRGIDKDIEELFLNLPSFKLESIFLRYGRLHPGKEAYARRTYSDWKSGKVRMSGIIAERLLNLVPRTLDVATRFELIKKLRRSQMPRATREISCAPLDWREKVAPVVDALLSASRRFQLSKEVLDRVHWLADGDAVAAHQLLAAVEEEEARVRIRYLAAEFAQIDRLLVDLPGGKSITHTIELPQGRIIVSISVPRQSLLTWMLNLFTSNE